MSVVHLSSTGWAVVGPWCMLAAVLFSVTMLARPRQRRSALHTATEPFRFVPRLLPDGMLQSVLFVFAAGIIGSAVWWGSLWIVLLTPLVLVVATHLLLWWARRRYQQQIETQLLDAVETLAALTQGSAAILSAFRRVAASSAAPLGTEWQWVDQHVNLSYHDVSAGRPVTQISDHAYALRALAAHTLHPIHAAVLRHLALIYMHGAEMQAAPRLRQLTEILRQQAAMRRALTVQLGRIRMQASVVVGAIGLILLWLAWSQPDRMTQAFTTPWGWAAALWIGWWILLPLVLATLLSRSPDLPL